ncbi:tyrosine-type recombinase/integrase [Gordonia terrae]
MDVLRDYLALHLRADEPTAPLFPAFRLTPPKQTGVRRRRTRVRAGQGHRQADALAALTVDDAEQRLDLDWSSPVRHQNFYKSVFRPAVLRAGTVPTALKFHALRHAYASLCVAAGIPPLEIARFMGHAKVTTTLSVYAHLFEDDHTDAMSALGAMGTPATGENVVRMRV